MPLRNPGVSCSSGSQRRRPDSYRGRAAARTSASRSAAKSVTASHIYCDPSEPAVGRRRSVTYGSIFAPRVAAADGALFNGKIAMQNATAAPGALAPATVTAGAELIPVEVGAVLRVDIGTDF